MKTIKNVKWILEPRFDWIDQYNEGLAPFSNNNKWGYIDRTGKIVIEAQFDQVLGFSEGLACVNINNKWGYIDREGRIIIKPQFDDLPDSFSEGLVRVAKYDRDINSFKGEGIISVRSKFGFADREGNIIIEPQYRHADHFSEGLASVEIDGKSGYINRCGIIIIEPVFDHALSFRNKKALVCLKQKWGFIEHPDHPENLNDYKTDSNIKIDDTNSAEKNTPGKECMYGVNP